MVDYKRWMEELGFETVVEKTFYWPTNAWAKGRHYKHVGAYFQADILNGIEGMSLKVIGQLGWTADEIRGFLPEVKKDLQDNLYLEVSMRGTAYWP